MSDATKTLKDRATQRAMAGSPLRYLGMGGGKKHSTLTQVVTSGLPAKSAEHLAKYLELPVVEFMTVYAGIPRQTAARRKQAGKFNTNESDRVARYARLLKYATDMMEGNRVAAIHWLKLPHFLFGDETPMMHARTEAGAEEVQQLIGRIEAGVWS